MPVLGVRRLSAGLGYDGQLNAARCVSRSSARLASDTDRHPPNAFLFEDLLRLFPHYAS